VPKARTEFVVVLVKFACSTFKTCALGMARIRTGSAEEAQILSMTNLVLNEASVHFQLASAWWTKYSYSWLIIVLR
jgi:hypothetical protein